MHSGGMSARPELYTEALERAWKHARDWLADVPGRRVPPRATADDLAGVLGGPLPDQPSDPGTVVDLLVAGVEPGLMAMPSGPVLRLGHRRHPARGSRRRLAHQRVGPERRDALRHTGCGSGGGGGGGVAARPARAAAGCRRRLHHGRDDGQLHRTGGRPPAGAGRCRLGRGAARAGGRPEGRRARRRGASRQRRPGAALPRPRRAHAGRRGRPGPRRAGRARRGPGGRRGADDRGAAGREPALRRLRPVP